jgi:glutamate-1-semialdehyde 2,1-aminomutase
MPIPASSRRAQQLERGTAFTMPTESEVLLAELLCERVPSFERVRFCNSGFEALMLALKAARSYTRRAKIAKIEGDYHGV